MAQVTIEDELKLEYEYKFTAMEKLKASLEKKQLNQQGSQTGMGMGIINHLYDNFSHNMKVFLENQLEHKRGTKPMYYRVLQWVAQQYTDPDECISLLCLATLSQAINQAASRIGSEHTALSDVSAHIGNMIYREAQLQEYLNYLSESQKGSENQRIYIGILNGLKTRNSDYYRSYYVQKIMKDKNWKGTTFDHSYLMAMGGALIEILLKSSDLFEMTNPPSMGKHRELSQIKPTQKFIDIWLKNTDAALMNVYITCPMIIPPKDWTGYDEGGYYGELSNYSVFLRLMAFQYEGIFFNQYLKKLKSTDLTVPMSAVNAIQRTPWKIDKKVLAVVKQVLDKKGGVADIPYTEPFEGLPRIENATPEQLKEQKRQAFLLYKKEASRKGKLLRVLANVRTAERFKDYERIYFPCNLDFRGRVYPIPSFSFQGDDLNKGLIQFADTPPITDPESERWFLIAGAEFAGIDKVSFDDEIKWVKDNHDNIMATADDPMGMIDYWSNLDSPWEFLQFAFEYKELQNWKKEHGSIVGWTTGVPVAFDGTCSGLQHFSAILRDPVGAEAVNLKPSDKPQDIYGRVAEVVNKILEEDAKNGTPDQWNEEKKRVDFGTKTMAQWWLNFGVNRKVTKRSVMTLAYGSKEYGFRDQVLEDTIKPHLDEGIWTNDNANQSAGYMAKLIWGAVGKVVVKAVEGMQWLQKVARMICKNNNVVQWTTPMGLVVQQTYLNHKVKVFKLRFAQTQKRFYVPYTTGDIDSRKQANAIAPNFIHSMDASHLQLTVCTASDKGINHFAMIHDSYGTTVAHAGQLFSIVRECFVQMYTEHDVLKEFAEEMRHLVNEDLPELPEKGTFDINEVIESLYAFH